MAKYSEKITWV